MSPYRLCLLETANFFAMATQQVEQSQAQGAVTGVPTAHTISIEGLSILDNIL